MTPGRAAVLLVAASLFCGCTSAEDEPPGDDDTTATTDDDDDSAPGDDDDDTTPPDDDDDDDDSAPPVESNARGVWIWASEYGSDPHTSPAAIDAHVREMVDTGFNLLFPLAKSSRAAYPSAVTGVHEGWEAFDFTGSLLESTAAASPDGRVEVHPWTCVYWTGSLLEEHPEYAAMYSDGTSDGTLACPGRPEVRERALAVADEILTRYDAAGIHLDYVRHAAEDTCFCDACRAEFQAQHGVDPLTLPLDDPDWVAFRVAQVTGFVEQVRALADAHHPPKYVSAAVFNKPTPTEARVQWAQDWVDWLDRGLLDFAIPMNYTPDPDFFTEITHGALDGLAPDHHIYIGIGLYLFVEEERDDAIDQVAIAEGLGADGTVMFRAESINDNFNEAAADAWAIPAYPPHSVTP